MKYTHVYFHTSIAYSKGTSDSRNHSGGFFQHPIQRANSIGTVSLPLFVIGKFGEFILPTFSGVILPIRGAEVGTLKTT